MALNNRDSFDYESYSRDVLGANDSDIPEDGYSEEQKRFLYDDAVNEVHQLNLKEFKGKNQKTNAINKTINSFEDARIVLGIPDEIVDFEEPYSQENLTGFLDSVHESNRDVPIKNVLGKYTSQFYDQEFSNFERPFLKDLDKKAFKDKLMSRYSDRIDFKNDTIAEAIDNLNASDIPISNDAVNELDPLADDPFSNRGELALDFTKNFATGFYNGLVNTTTGAVRGVDLLINGSDANEFVFDPETSKILRVGNDGTVREANQEDADKIINPDDPSILTNIANTIQDVASIEVDDSDLSFTNKLALGAGGLASFLIGGAVGKAISGTRGGAVAATTGMGISQGGESGYQDYVQSIEATGQPFDESMARKATAFNALIGASEALPVLKALDRLTADGNIPIGTFLKRIDEATGNSVSRAFNKVASNKTGNVIGSGVAGAIEEGGQEIFQSLASNWVASDLLSFDPERGFYTDETQEGGEIGAILGAFANTLFAALPGKQRVQVANDLSDQQQPNENVNEDITADIQERAADQEVQVDIREIDGDFIATSGSRTGVGNTEIEAQADLRSKEPTPLSQNETLTVSTTSLDDGVSQSVLTTDDIEVTFTGPNAENQLRTLVNNNDPDGDPLTNLPNGLTITQNEDNTYTIELNDISVTGEDLQTSLGQVNAELNNISTDGRGFDIKPETLPQPSLIPISTKTVGFDPEAAQTELENDGFTVLDNPIKNANTPVTKTRFRAYKNGFIYDVKRSSKGSNSNQFNIQIQDLDGNKFRANNNEGVQEFNRRGVPQNAVADPAFGRVSNTESTPANVTGIVLRQPLKGIKLKEATVAGEQVRVIEAESVDEVAKRIGAEIIYQSPNQDRVIIEKNGQSTEFTINEDGKFIVTADGVETEFDEGFEFIDTSRGNEATIGTMTRELETNGYTVFKVDENNVYLNNNQNNTVVLPRKSDSNFVIVDGQEFPVERLEDLTDATGITEPVIVEVESTRNVVFQNNPDVIDMNIEKQETVNNLFDLTDQEAKVTIEDGVPVFLNGGNTKVVMDVRPDEITDTIEQIRVNASIPTEAEIEAQSQNDFSVEQVENYVDTLPAHIQEIINLHYTEDNPAREIGAWGYFTPSDFTNLPAIHIDANRKRDFHSVLSTISEEVAHFSFNSWNIPELTAVVDRAYDLVKAEAVRGLQGYIEKYNIDVDNPTPGHKSLLVNEFFSKQGTSFVDFDDNKIELPPGVTRKQLQDLKKDVEGTLVKVTFDLTSDFKGDREDGMSFIMDILRLQAGAVIGTGVQLDYKINQNDGTPATIEVLTTPYGTQKQVIPESRNARRAAAIRKRMANATGWYKKIQAFITSDVEGIVDTPIGRENSIILSGVYNPTSSTEASILKRVTIQADTVRAILDTVGVGEIPIDTSYYQTFLDNGITKEKDLKLAKEMDQFIRMSYGKANTNTGVIRSMFRESKVTIAKMVVNHPGARRNLPRWLREIELSSRRFTSDWDHIAYEAHQPGGDKDLITMRNAINHGGELAEQSTKAATKIRKLKVQIRDNPNDTNSNIKRRVQIAELQRTVDLRKRLNSLRQWASDEVEIRGVGSTRGIMISELGKITGDNQNYHVQRANGLNDFISALRGRTLNENIEHDADMMDFLGRITDPLRVAITNLEQQNKVINNMNHTNRLAIALVRDGIAQPIGSTNSETLFDVADQQVLSSTNGGVLNFLEVDPELAPFIREDIEQNKALYRNVVGSGFFGNLITSIKANQTILSPKLAASNYLSNLSVLISGGHFAYINKFGRDSLKGIKTAWTSQTSFGHKTSDGSVGDMIAREMAELGVFQGSVTSLDAQLSNGQVIQRTLNGITKFINQAGILNTGKRITIDDRVNKFMEGATKFYSFGDEYSKVLPYLVNRQIGIAKAETQIKRDRFAAGRSGQAEYEAAVVDVGTRIAADRTSRETNNWVIAPSFIRGAVKNKTRFIIGDYILHPFQALRIMIENKRLIVEDLREYKQAKVDGNLEYAEIMKKSSSSRIIGNVINDAATVTLAAGAITPLGYLIATVFNAFDDDKEDTTTEQKTDLTADEFDAAYRISNTTNNGWGGAAYYPVVRDGYKVTYYDGKRLSAMNTLVPTRPPTDAVNGLEYVKDFMGNFLNTENESIALKLLNRGFRGIDRNGNEMTLDQQWNEVGEMFIPGLIKQSWEFGSASYDVMNDPTETNGPNREQIRLEKAAQFLGVKVKTVDVRDEVSSVGWMINNQMNKAKNPQLKDLMNTLTTGDSVSPSEIRESVKRMVDDNDEVMGYVTYGISAYRDFGLSNNLIDKHFRLQTDGLTGPKKIDPKLTGNLLKGINGFHIKTISKLKNLKDDITDKAKVSNKLSTIEIQNKIEALDSAISLYEGYIKQKPR